MLVLLPSIVAVVLLARGFAAITGGPWITPSATHAERSEQPVPAGSEASPSASSSPSSAIAPARMALVVTGPAPAHSSDDRAASPEPAHEATPKPRPSLDPASVPRCPLEARVTLVVADDASPSHSLAVVAFSKTGGNPVLREGDVVVGRRVAAITGERVYLRDAKGYCWV
jgi:hypothetical protein